MLVSSIMSRDPLVVAPDCSPADAYEVMSREDIRHLPVVADGAVLGVLSDRDLLEALGSRPDDTPPETPGSVDELMSRELASLSPEDTVVTATVAFLVHRIGCLPVLDGQTLVGIVTEMDMLQAFTELVRGGRVAAGGGSVDELMATALHVIAPSTALADAWHLMSEQHVRHLPVVDDGQPVGLVSDRDLRRALGDGATDETPVSSVMAGEMLEIVAGSPLGEAAFLMTLSKVSALPVLDDGKLVGLLTLTDLLENCLESLREPEAGSAS